MGAWRTRPSCPQIVLEHEVARFQHRQRGRYRPEAAIGRDPLDVLCSASFQRQTLSSCSAVDMLECRRMHLGTLLSRHARYRPDHVAGKTQKRASSKIVT
jgi:hypothetical protein